MTPQIHTSYEVSKRLKEFLGEAAPEPMDYDADWYAEDKSIEHGINIKDFPRYGIKGNWPYPAYQLHDLLSKSFTEAFRKALPSKVWPLDSRGISERLSSIYWWEGLPAVERALMEMMDTDKEKTK